MHWKEAIHYIKNIHFVAVAESGRITYLIFLRAGRPVLRERDAWYTTDYHDIAKQMKHPEGFDIPLDFRIENARDWKKELYAPAQKVY